MYQHCYCVASIKTPEDHGRMVKAFLLLFVWDYGDPYFPLNCQLMKISPNPATGPITPENFKMARSVECPDFEDMGMTVDGTLLFLWEKMDFLIDDQTLKTGLIMATETRDDGSVAFSARFQPEYVWQIWEDRQELLWRLGASVNYHRPPAE